MKSEKTNKLALCVEKGLALKQKAGLKFADTVSQKSGQISAKLVVRLSTCSLKRMYNSQNLPFEKKRKMYFLRRLASNEIITSQIFEKYVCSSFISR